MFPNFKWAQQILGDLSGQFYEEAPSYNNMPGSLVMLDKHGYLILLITAASIFIKGCATL
jgi:hypothetical protein